MGDAGQAQRVAPTWILQVKCWRLYRRKICCMLNERLQLACVYDYIAVLVVGVPAWSLLWSGSWCLGTSNLESVPMNQALLTGKSLFPHPVHATCCCLWLGSTGTGSLQGQQAGKRVSQKWGQENCSRIIAPLKNLIAKITSCLL